MNKSNQEFDSVVLLSHNISSSTVVDIRGVCMYHACVCIHTHVHMHTHIHRTGEKSKDIK